jgi:hypothetical protein
MDIIITFDWVAPYEYSLKLGGTYFETDLVG